MLADPANARASRLDHRFLLPVLVAAVLAFLAGYAVGTRRYKAAVFYEGRRQLIEFLLVGEETGILMIDRERMAGIIGGDTTADNGR